MPENFLVDVFLHFFNIKTLKFWNVPQMNEFHEMYKDYINQTSPNHSYMLPNRTNSKSIVFLFVQYVCFVLIIPLMGSSWGKAWQALVQQCC